MRYEQSQDSSLIWMRSKVAYQRAETFSYTDAGIVHTRLLDQCTSTEKSLCILTNLCEIKLDTNSVHDSVYWPLHVLRTLVPWNRKPIRNPYLSICKTVLSRDSCSLSWKPRLSSVMQGVSNKRSTCGTIAMGRHPLESDQ